MTEIYIYAFSRCVYPKRLTVHSGQAIHFCQYVCSLGIEPTTLCAAKRWRDFPAEYQLFSVSTLTILIPPCLYKSKTFLQHCYQTSNSILIS